MRHLFASCLLLAAAALVGAPAVGQDKKGAKKAAAKEGVITINEGMKDGKFRFTVRDGEGKTLAGLSAAYATAKDAEKGVETLKTVLGKAKATTGKKPDKFPKDGVILIGEGKDKAFRFSVYDGEGHFLVNSGSNAFATAKDAEKGVDAFKKVVATAKVSLGAKKKPAK